MKPTTRRTFLALSAGVAAGMLTGCLTPRLFQARLSKEVITSILMTADCSRLVVISDDHHYVFDTDMVPSLKASFRPWLRAGFTRFEVDGEGKTQGKVTLFLTEDAPAEALAEAKRFHFNVYHRGGALQQDFLMRGTRYAARRMKPGTAQKLNRNYTVEVLAERTAGDKAARSLLTPLTVTADGLLVLGVSSLFLLDSLSSGRGGSAGSWR